MSPEEHAPQAGAPGYLAVRYAASKRPETTYPDELASYLHHKYLAPAGLERGEFVDLGCGRGEFLASFAKLGFSCSGLDREPAIARARGHFCHAANFECDRLPIPDSSVDILFSKSVLEHTQNITHLLGETHRILKPNGIALILVPDWRAQWRHFYDDWTHVRPFTQVGLQECLESHGFWIQECQRFRQLPLLWKHPSLHLFSDVLSLLPDAWKGLKWVRFSKEWMLLAVARKTALPPS